MGQGKFDYHWSASFGFDRQEPYTAYETRTDRNGNSRQVAVTRYRTVTDWRPASGNGSARFLRLVSAADSGVVPNQVGEMMEESVAYTPIAYNQNLMAGYPSLDFAYSPEQAASALESLVTNKDATRLAHKRAQGDRQRNWSIDAVVTFDGPVKAGLIPLAKFVYSYEGKNYVIWAEATKLERHIVEGGPVDKGRRTDKAQGYIPLWVTLGAVAITIVLTLTGTIPPMEGTPTIYASVGAFVFSLVYGLMRSSSISKFSKALREASFSAKRLELTDSSGSPLPDTERRALLDKSRPPEKPFLAKTENDRRNLTVLSFLCALAIIISVFLGIDRYNRFYDIDYYDPPYQSQTSSEQSAESSAEGQSASGQNSGTSGESQGASSWDQSASGQSSGTYGESQSSSSWDQSASGQSSGSSGGVQESNAYGAYQGGTQSSTTQGGSAIFDMSQVTCTESEPIFCHSNGTPVNGLAYQLRDRSGDPSAYRFDYLVKVKDGRIEGPIVFYQPNGDMNYVESLKGSLCQGLQIGFHPKENGNHQNIQWIGECQDGKINGTAYMYDIQGNVVAIQQFYDSQPNGDSVGYYPDGTIKSKASFTRGTQNGETRQYSQGEFREPIPTFNQMALLREIMSEVDQITAQVPNIP
jgi:hypothetical protein